MKRAVLAAAAISSAALANGASAALVQVGDFRLPSATAATQTYYNTFSYTTRAVTGAPVAINSTFSGTSQNNDATIDSSTATTEDFSLQTYTATTTLRTLSRYAATSAQAVAGAVQWSFDLTPLAGYLSSTGQQLNQVEFLLSTTETQTATLPFDVYLSYTDPAQGTTITGLSASQGANYTNLYSPAQAPAVGSTVDSSFVVLAKGSTGADLTDDLTSLYTDGVRQFDLLAVANTYGANRSIVVGSTAAGLASGIYIDTSTASVPEPTTLAAIAGAGLLALRRSRRNSR